MPKTERRPSTIIYVNLGELLPPSVKPDFKYGRFTIDGRSYYLSGKIPAETRAPNWRGRKKTAETLTSSVSEATRILSPVSKIVGRMPPQRPAFVSIFAAERPDSARIGVATRIELDSFGGRLSSPDESFLASSLKETIKLAENERGNSKMLEETKELVKKAITEKRNLLCLFTLGGFFACLLSKEDEIRVSPHEGLLVPMAGQIGLVRPTELISLFFLLRVKQLGENRIRALSPAEWIALVNYRDLLALRKFSMSLPEDNKGFWSIIHPHPTEEVYKTGRRDPAASLAIKISPFSPKPGGLGEKPHSRKPQPRTWR